MNDSMSHLILKNAFARHPSCKKYFINYFNDCIANAYDCPSLSEAISFTKEGETALSIYSEKARLNKKILSVILNCQEQIDSAYQSLSVKIAEEDEVNARVQDAERKKNEERELSAESERHLRIISKNQAILDQLQYLLNDFYKITEQEEFNSGLERMSDFENSLSKDSFTELQADQYKKLTNEFSKVVSDILANIERNKDVAYNVLAIDKFKEVFSYSKESKKIKLDKNARLQIAPLFQYETSRLFPESIVYYNYVYSSIFAKLNDDDKYELTMLSVNTPKIK